MSLTQCVWLLRLFCQVVDIASRPAQCVLPTARPAMAMTWRRWTRRQ
jgi:hypothetical protein